MSRLRRVSDYIVLTGPADQPRPRWWEFLLLGVFFAILGLIVNELILG